MSVILRKYHNIGANHNIISYFQRAVHPAIKSQSGVVPNFYISSGGKINTMFNIYVFSRLFKNPFAKKTSYLFEPRLYGVSEPGKCLAIK